MKITPEHYERIRERVQPQMSQTGLRCYMQRGLTLRRYVWDCLHAASRDYPEFGRFMCVELYGYADDTHIETALFKIAKEVELAV